MGGGPGGGGGATGTGIGGAGGGGTNPTVWSLRSDRLVPCNLDSISAKRCFVSV